MLIKTGVDIIEIERIKKSIEETEGSICPRIYTTKEIEYCESKRGQKYQHYAARFAGKEAVFKAISSILSDKNDVIWTDIEILNDENGRPHVKVFNKDIKGNIDISLSHCKEYAIASVVFAIYDKNEI